MFNLVFSRRYAMAHRLRFCGSEKCAIPHGHNETVTVRLTATEPARLDGTANLVVPFDEAKGRWHEWIDAHVDHALQLSEDDPLIDYFAAHEPDRLRRIMTFPGDPSTETLAACFMSKANAFLTADGGRLRCTQVGVEETPTNCVTFDGDPAAVLPERDGADFWWQRADMSINEFAEPVDLNARRTSGAG